MTNIYFVRHAQPDLNIKDNYIRPLSKIGENDALEVFNYLKEIKFDVIFSSPYKRSYKTIEKIANKNNLDIIKIDKLKERMYGNRNIDINEFFYKQWHDFDFKCENGESLNDCIKRNVEVINDILVNYKNKTILIGYHGTCLCALLHYFDNSFNYEDFLKYKLCMPLVIKMNFSNNEFINYEELFKIERGYEDIEKLI